MCSLVFPLYRRGSGGLIIRTQVPHAAAYGVQAPKRHDPQPVLFPPIWGTNRQRHPNAGQHGCDHVMKKYTKSIEKQALGTTRVKSGPASRI